MSRIHEALKKAEQERAASEESPSQSSSVPSTGAEPALPVKIGSAKEEPPKSLSAPAAFPIPMPSFAGPLSPDALLTRCPQLPWQPDEKTMLFFNGDDTARGTEEFRTLRSRLYHTREKMTLKKILVTSALPKEGKSFTSANLAQVLVKQHGRRVLLIDADLRGPRLHLMLGTTASPGLADYLQGTRDEFAIMQRGPMENLLFIPSGQHISDAAELVANGRLKMLLQRLEPLFDWIVIDSPPVVPVSDATILAKACDGVVMVLRSNSTPIELARRAREEFPDESLVGVVLNATDHQSSPYSRYYYNTYVKKLTSESKA
jgi:protein-tyrosine kinase